MDDMLDRIAETGAVSEVKYADLVRVYNSSEHIDKAVREKTANWELKRMAAIDRNILLSQPK